MYMYKSVAFKPTASTRYEIYSTLDTDIYIVEVYLLDLPAQLCMRDVQCTRSYMYIVNSSYVNVSLCNKTH